METFLGSECTAMKHLCCKSFETKDLRSSCQIFRFKDLILRQKCVHSRIWDLHIKDFHSRT